ncbi:N-acetylmuramoyl-L-alanine amidase, partial [Streptomyces regensis]
MDLIRRAQWGAPATSPADRIARTRGVKVHYLGTAYTSRPHDQCDDQVRAIRAAHLAHPTENYS